MQELLSKEKILECYEYDVHYYGGGRRHILEAMERFAKQQSVLFGQFVTHNDWVYLPSKKLWYNEEQEESITPKTDDQLYNLFLEHQKQQ